MELIRNTGRSIKIERKIARRGNKGKRKKGIERRFKRTKWIRRRYQAN